jgi:hypothetical protein
MKTTAILSDAAPAPEPPTCCGMPPLKRVFPSQLTNNLVTLTCQNTLCVNHKGVQAFEGADISRKWDKHRNRD